MENTNQIIRSEKRYGVNHGWLQTFHIFSFADYFDPKNVSFGNLRVFNDDYIASKSWFWLHPHSNMEILTIVLEWAITHGDTLWNRQTTYAWEVQTMTAGSGLFHSEENIWNQQVHLFQIWFFPNTQNLDPHYKNHKIELKDNTLNLITSWDENDHVWFIHSDVKVYRGKYQQWEKFTYEIPENRWMFVYVYRGNLELWWEKIWEWDQLRYVEPGVYNFTSFDDWTDFMLIEVAL